MGNSRKPNAPLANMKAQEGAPSSQEPMSYQQLKDAFNQAVQQNQMLNRHIQQMQMQLQEFARGERIQVLNFAFKVVEFGNQFDSEFVFEMKKTIMEALTPVEPEAEVPGKEE